MKRGLKTFARAIRDGDVDSAEEMFKKIVQGNMEEDVWTGYRRALGGMIVALDEGEDLTLPKQIASGRISKDKLEKIKGEIEERSSSEFRPADEMGYNAAWSDVLQVILEDWEE